MLECCRDLGFAQAGIAPLTPMRREAEMRQWLAEGKHGSMAYLAEHADLKADPEQLLEGATSAIMVADQYATRQDAAQEHHDGHGRIARYAQGKDYHKVMKKRLHALCDEIARRWPQARTRAFVDTAPVHERELALAAGLGWVGKHTLIIHPRFGSWLLLGGVLTTLELETNEHEEPDHCGTCTRCIDACPTDAITPYGVDARRCISYLTIERRAPIDPDLREGMGDWIFGCDVCQEVCPHNSPRSSPAGSAHQAYEPGHKSFDLAEVLGWSEEARRAAFAGSAMKRAKLHMMKRNALIAASNEVRRLGRDHPSSVKLLSAMRSITHDAQEPLELRRLAREILMRLAGKPKFFS